MDVRIRKMERQDVVQVSLLEKETFSAPWPEQAFLDVFEDVNIYYYVADIGGEIVGNCGVRNIVGEGEITNVAVRKDWRNRKIGQKMLEVLLQEGEDAGIQAFTLEVRESNHTAVHLYQKLGFVTEGVRKNFYEKPRENALIMWKR